MHFFDSRICKSFAIVKFFVSKQKPGHRKSPDTNAHFLYRDLRMGSGEGSPDGKRRGPNQTKTTCLRRRGEGTDAGIPVVARGSPPWVVAPTATNHATPASAQCVQSATLADRGRGCSVESFEPNSVPWLAPRRGRDNGNRPYMAGKLRAAAGHVSPQFLLPRRASMSKSAGKAANPVSGKIKELFKNIRL
ncbi:MAG: hypothetical protein OES35_00925 [Chromatiales bacterium]|nr:hypothetical protein [Chromatiales bacterium]